MGDHLTSELMDHVTTIAGSVAGTALTPSTDLLDAGFDSLDALELATRIEDELGIPCTLDDIFDCPSLLVLVERLASRAARDRQPRHA